MKATERALTDWTTCGGCAAKWGAGLIEQLTSDLGQEAPQLLTGLRPYDDAAVFKLSDELALVSTTDFFPPLVDDPFDFGAIAAANACSDVFAMGGRVILALNLAAFPEDLPRSQVSGMLAGASEVVSEAGGVVAGGHTIRSAEPIFGLAVQGLVHPSRVWTKGGAMEGDIVLLSKPIGTGVLLAVGAGAGDSAVVAGMRSLNAEAASVLSGSDVLPHAVTDVTGYGLLGHAWEVAERSGVCIRIRSDLLPVYEGAREAAQAGYLTGGGRQNGEHLKGKADLRSDEVFQALALDPQTSGGLLVALPEPQAEVIEGRAGFVRIGEVGRGPAGVVLL